MENAIKRMKTFVSYWYLRYLLAIELYIVEPWERAVFHVIFAVIFAGVWYLNYSMTASPIQTSKPYMEMMARTLI